jgi:hypothetical protein
MGKGHVPKYITRVLWEDQEFYGQTNANSNEDKTAQRAHTLDVLLLMAIHLCHIHIVTVKGITISQVVVSFSINLKRGCLGLQTCLRPESN